MRVAERVLDARALRALAGAGPAEDEDAVRREGGAEGRRDGVQRPRAVDGPHEGGARIHVEELADVAAEGADGAPRRDARLVVARRRGALDGARHHDVVRAAQVEDGDGGAEGGLKLSRLHVRGRGRGGARRGT